MSGQTAALRLARLIIDDSGAEIDDAGDVMRVELSVRAMAKLADLSAGTVQKYLTRLDELGVRVDGGQRLFSTARLAELEGPVATPSPFRATPPSSKLPARAELGRAFVALCDLVEADPRQLPTAEGVVTEWLRDLARPVRAGLRDRTNVRDSPRAAIARAASSEKFSNRLSNEPIHESVDAAVARSPLSRGAQGFDPLETIGPLVEACERLSLVGVTDSKQLAARLAPFDEKQVRYAVDKLLVEVNNGLKKPVGKLANVATEASVDYFPSDPPTVRLPGDPAPPADESFDVDDLGEVPIELDTPVRGLPQPVDAAIQRDRLAEVRKSLENMAKLPS